MLFYCIVQTHGVAWTVFHRPALLKWTRVHSALAFGVSIGSGDYKHTQWSNINNIRTLTVHFQGFLLYYNMVFGGVALVTGAGGKGIGARVAAAFTEAGS